jgi:hypothetical protein
LSFITIDLDILLYAKEVCCLFLENEFGGQIPSSYIHFIHESNINFIADVFLYAIGHANLSREDDEKLILDTQPRRGKIEDMLKQSHTQWLMSTPLLSIK